MSLSGVTLPNHEYAPAEFPKFGSRVLISFAVAGQFCDPNKFYWTVVIVFLVGSYVRASSTHVRIWRPVAGSGRYPVGQVNRPGEAGNDTHVIQESACH